METRSGQAHGDHLAARHLPAALRPHLWLWIAWFASYGVLGELTGWYGLAVLAATADHVESLWLSLTVLNVPAHLCLALVSLLLAASPHPWARRSLGVTAWTLTALIVAHVALTAAVTPR